MVRFFLLMCFTPAGEKFFWGRTLRVDVGKKGKKKAMARFFILRENGLLPFI
jgi:hypothetical protein